MSSSPSPTPSHAPIVRRRASSLAFALVALGLTAGCTALLGDFTTNGGDPVDAGGSDVTVVEAGGDAAVCGPTLRACPNGSCAGPEDPRACGPTCAVCPGATGGTPVCTPGGECKIRCSPGSEVCGSACLDLNRDRENCGACGASCGGGECNAGKCAPIEINGQLTSATDLVVSPLDVFVNSDGKVRRCPKTGCMTATPLWLSSVASVPGPHMLGIDLNYAYFAADYSGNRYLHRCQLGGCASSPDQIVTTPAQPTGNFETFTIAGNAFLFVGTYSGVREAPLTNGAVGRTYTNFAGSFIAGATPDYVVWSDKFGGGVRQCPRTGAGCNTSNALTTFDTTTELVTFGDRAFFVGAPSGANVKQQIQSCNAAGCSGAPTVIASGEDTITSLTADASGVYWTTQTGSVRACKNLGGGCGANAVTLATGQTAPRAVTVDVGFVYWLATGASNDAVRRVRK